LNIIKAVLDSPAATLAPSDAKVRNINSGDNIRIFSKFGQIVTTAAISDRIPSGIIVMPNGIWLDEGGGSNMLIEARFTDIGFGAAFHDTRVEVEKAD
jgi:anaerobic selenocysteine-containing dehydrogenase